MTSTVPVTRGGPTSSSRLEAVPDGAVLRTSGTPAASRRSRSRLLAAWLTADAAAAGLVSLLPFVATVGRIPMTGLVVLWLLALSLTGSYSPGAAPLWPGGARRMAVAGLVIAAALPWLMPSPGEWHAVATGCVLVVTSLMTRQASLLLPVVDATRAAPLRVVVSGHRREIERVVAELAASRTPRYEVVAVCGAGQSSAGAFEEVCEAALRHRADAVLVAPCGHVAPSDLRRLGWQLERSRTQLLLATSLVDVSPARTRMSYAGSLALVSVSHPSSHGPRLLLKSVVDRVLAALGLILLAPVLVGVALVVRLDSPGNPIFRQTRMGRNGSTFTLYKFRTMRRDADACKSALGALAGDSVLFKIRDDPRTTRVGRILRRYSIDELPQLLNVVQGDMALVGPRPPLPQEVAKYHLDVHRRLLVKPGMTGLWQISGRSDLSWDESVRLDLRYVDNWSLGLDVGILARTLGAVVHHRGAY